MKVQVLEKLDFELEYRDHGFIVFLLPGASSAWHIVGAHMLLNELVIGKRSET